MNGKMWLTQPLGAGATVIRHQLPAGIYLMVFETDSGRAVRRLTVTAN
jgi:hypothetical protein